MAIALGDVVWFNAGQGPFTVTLVSTDIIPNVTVTQGSAGALQTIPAPCLTKKNPNPRMEYDRDLLKNSLLGTGSSLVGSSV